MVKKVGTRGWGEYNVTTTGESNTGLNVGQVCKCAAVLEQCGLRSAGGEIRAAHVSKRLGAEGVQACRCCRAVRFCGVSSEGTDWKQWHRAADALECGGSPSPSRSRPGSASAGSDLDIGFRTAENGRMGNWDKLSGRMSLVKTVFKLRSTPAPSLTAALDAKPEVAPAPNRYAAPALPIRGPRISETRTISQLGDRSAAQGSPCWLSTTGENGPWSESASATVGASAS